MCSVEGGWLIPVLHHGLYLGYRISTMTTLSATAPVPGAISFLPETASHSLDITHLIISNSVSTQLNYPHPNSETRAPVCWRILYWSSFLRGNLQKHVPRNFSPYKTYLRRLPFCTTCKLLSASRVPVY